MFWKCGEMIAREPFLNAVPANVNDEIEAEGPHNMGSPILKTACIKLSKRF